MKTYRIVTPGRAAVLGLSLLTLAGCSGGGGSSEKKSPAKFLKIESRVDRGGTEDASGPELLAVANRLLALWVDTRNGTEELFLNRSENGGKTWRAQDIAIPGSPGTFGVDPIGRKLAVSGDDVVVVFEEGDDMYSNVSHDGGLTWKASATRLDSGGVNATDSDDPTVRYDDGKYYAVWRDDVNGEADVLFSRSTDLGETWSVAVQVNTTAPGTAYSDKPRMIVASDGALHVVWEDDRNDPGGDRDVYYTTSSDGGTTWLPADVQVSDGSGDVESPELASNGSSVYLIWDDDRGGDRGIYFRRSLDGGATWAGSDVRLDATSPGVSAADAVIAADGDLVVVGWKAQDPGPEDDLFVNISSDGGANWLPAPLRLDQDAPGVGDSDGVRLAVLGLTIVAAWEDDRSGLDDVYLRFSRDGGATWSDERFAEETAQGSSDATGQALTLSAAGAWVAWHDDRNGNLDVFVNGGVLPNVP